LSPQCTQISGYIRDRKSCQSIFVKKLCDI
jgi:hypothetical protein